MGKVGDQRRPLACANNLAERLRTTDGAGQLITVEADSFQTSVAEVSLWQRDGSCWEQAGGPWTGLIGENGFSNHHREGDGTTPTGIYRIGPVVYGNAPNPGFRRRTTVSCVGIGGTKTPLRPATTPSSTCRAALRHRSAGTARLCGPRRPTTRALRLSSTTLIRWCLTAGSAIFVHADTGTATTGCVSIPLSELDVFLRWLDLSRLPTIAMAPASELASF